MPASGLPKLPGLVPKRRPRRGGLDYSYDPRKDRRKRPRVSIEELSERGAEALKERLPDIEHQKRRSGVTKVLDILDLPRNVVANVIAGLAGVDTSGKRKGAALPKVFVSDILEKLGVEKGALRSVAGFVGDVAIDPLTYVNLGATTGTRVARHLPKLVGGAAQVVKQAGKTGYAGSALARAMGSSPAKLRTVFQRFVNRYGEKSATKRMRRLVEQRLSREATRGAPDALTFFKHGAQKGRPLFRAPFAKKGVMELPFGKEARKYQDILRGLSTEGRAGYRQIAQQGKALSAAKRAVAEMDEALTAGKKQARSLAGQKGHATHMARQGKPLPAEQVELLQAQRDDLAQRIKEFVARKKAKTTEAGEIGGRLTAMRTGPEAPGPLRSLKEATIGRDYIAEGGGIINRARQAKQQLFGPSPGPLWQKLLGVRERWSKGARAAGMRAEAKLTREIEPIVRRLMQQTGRSADEVRRLVYHVAEAGPAGPTGLKIIAARVGKAAGQSTDEVERLIREVAAIGPQQADAVADTLARITGESRGAIRRLALGITGRAGLPPGLAMLREDDVLIQLYKQAQQLGIADDPQLVRVLRGYYDEMERIGGGKIDWYVHRSPTKELRRRTGIQAYRGEGKPGIHPGGRMSAFRPPDISRTHWKVFELPGGQKRHVMSTAKDGPKRIAEIKALGGKQVGTKQISTAQFNKIAQAAPSDPQRMALFGPEFSGEKPFAGPMFEESLAKSAGARARHAEQKIAAQQMQELVRPFRVDSPEALRQFGHLAKPHKKPTAGNPFAELADTGMFDAAYPRQVADMIDQMTAVWELPSQVQSLVGATDIMLGWWKTAQLFHPAYVLRNAFQNAFGTLMAGGNPIRAAQWARSPQLRAVRQAVLTGDTSALRGTVSLFGREIPLTQVYQQARQYHLVGAGRAFQEIGRQAGLTASQAALGTAQRGGRAVTSAVFRANTAMEDLQKLGAWMQFMERGLSPEDAVLKTLQAMPDLSDITAFEKAGIARIFPWWRWTRRNGALQLFHYLPQKPAYAAMLPRFKNFIEGWRGKDNVPEELRPMWQQEQVGMQISGSREAGQTFLAQTWFPFEEVYQAGQAAGIAPGEAARRFVGQMRPGPRAVVEAATGRSVFRGEPLEAVRPGSVLPALGGRSGTALDTLLGLRPVREWGPGGRVAQMPTPGAKAQRAVLGGAIQPVDYQRGLQARYYELDRLQRELRSQYNRALQAGDQARADSLMRQWTAVVRQMWQWKLPLPRRVEQTMAAAGVGRAGPP